MGEPDGSRSLRAETLSRLLTEAGLKAPVQTRTREEIWVKLWGNLAFNPLSALTCSTLDRLTGQSDLRSIARAMMVEAQDVAEALGIRFPTSVDKRITGAAEAGAHKASMLQDIERGRQMEIDAMLGSRRWREIVGRRLSGAGVSARAEENPGPREGRGARCLRWMAVTRNMATPIVIRTGRTCTRAEAQQFPCTKGRVPI